MANYIKIKRGTLMQNCLTTAMARNQILEEWEDIEDVEKRIEKLRKEVEGRSNEGNMLKGKTTQESHLLLQPSKRFEICLLYERGFLE